MVSLKSSFIIGAALLAYMADAAGWSVRCKGPITDAEEFRITDPQGLIILKHIKQIDAGYTAKVPDESKKLIEVTSTHADESSLDVEKKIRKYLKLPGLAFRRRSLRASQIAREVDAGIYYEY